jgi:ligand-binding SRPBCC domain-containing protein
MLTERSIGDAFAIFEDPYNLAKITPGWLNFKVTSPQRIQMRKGAEIHYTIKWLGVPIRWKTIIREYEPPRIFIDQQAEGPYTLWLHRHTFRETPDGTVVADHVDYALPMGLLGRLAHAVAVRKQLLEIFDYRQEQLAKLLGGSTRQIAAPAIR